MEVKVRGNETYIRPTLDHSTYTMYCLHTVEEMQRLAQSGAEGVKEILVMYYYDDDFDDEQCQQCPRCLEEGEEEEEEEESNLSIAEGVIKRRREK